MVEDSNLYSPKEGFSKNIISTEVGCGCSYAVVHLYIHIIAQNSYGLTIPPYIIQTVSGVVYIHNVKDFSALYYRRASKNFQGSGVAKMLSVGVFVSK